MKTKTFEVRDAMTFIVVIATKLKPGNQQEEYLLSRAGFKADDERIVVTKLQSMETHYHADQWGDKTMQTIHSHLEESFDELGFGVVLDAEFLRGESKYPRHSERGTPHQILKGEDEWGMTLKEFADGMKEVEESRVILDKFRATKFNNVKEMIVFLYNLRPNIKWVGAILETEKKGSYTKEQIQQIVNL